MATTPGPGDSGSRKRPLETDLETMANQTKRRAEQDASALDRDPNPDQENKTIYEPLKEGSTRLLKIVRASNEGDRIACEIVQAAFGEKRKFEALSYKWGEKMAEKPILLNGVEMKIRQNLSDALVMLRNRPDMGMLYWIDALCINQDDVVERSLHAQMMHSIYFRASTVLVWLGKKYDKYESMLPALSNLCNVTELERQVKIELGMEENSPVNSLPMAEEVYSDEYWDRVWTVQEIGLARHINVCFGKACIGWTAFMNIFSLHKVGNQGPLKIHATKVGRYDGSCNLFQLLNDYRDVQCQDPKDKLYVLISLATDVQCFPMDYNKSFFEIWRDVMVFANGHRLLEKRDSVAVGALVKSILMGNQFEPLERLMAPYEPADEASLPVGRPKLSEVFQVPGKIIGCVKHVGPRLEEIVGNPFKHDVWQKSVQANFQNEQGSANLESDMLLRAILDPEGPDLSLSCFTHVSAVQWTSHHRRSFGEGQEIYIDVIRRFQGEAREADQVSEAEATADSKTRNMRLYQLGTLSDAKKWRMGLASDKVRPGDLICWVEYAKRAVILRPCVTNDYNFMGHAVGTAAVASDLQGISLVEHSNRYRSFTPISGSSVEVPLYLDATFIFVLLEHCF